MSKENDKLVECSLCGKEEKNYWIKQYGWCFWCNHKKEEERELERLKKETVKDGKSYCENYIICPYCGYSCSEEELYESTDTPCDECNKEFHLEVEHTPSYSTSKIRKVGEKRT